MSRDELQPVMHPWATAGMGKGGPYAWFDPAQGTAAGWGRHLPHWRQQGALYFVTFRTEDSLPPSVLEAWQKERARWLWEHPEPHDEATQQEYHRLFTERMHRFLDESHGDCLLKDPEVREMMTEVLLKMDGDEEGYFLDAFVVMPNHVHALVAPSGRQDLSAIGKAWKNVSAHRINKHLGRKGALWQHESWDHIVRGPEHLQKYRRYILRNPAQLPVG